MYTHTLFHRELWEQEKEAAKAENERDRELLMVEIRTLELQLQVLHVQGFCHCVVAVFRSVLQGVAVCGNVLHCVYK